ncbi:MAG: type II toxin-antitoxin system HicA family toxin [Defluviitaleaceae bacterium]|nr:type II toxin-antitoxin system HicA family toxin [Defluviitaleaceae bacterium]
MKRRDLIKKLEQNGWHLERHGSKHDIYTNGTKREAISRQVEINEILAKKILKRSGIR